MFVHGGNWDSGDKNDRAGGADVYANIGRFDAARGLGVAVDNYRLQPAVAWPSRRERPNWRANSRIAGAAAFSGLNVAATPRHRDPHVIGLQRPGDRRR